VLRTRPSRYGRKRCFTNDEGGSLEVGVQAQTSNHRKRRGLRVVVGSAFGQSGSDTAIDSAEKPIVHPSRASGRTEELLKSFEIFRSC